MGDGVRLVVGVAAGVVVAFAVGATVAVGVAVGINVGVAPSNGWVGSGLNSNPPNLSRKAAGVTFCLTGVGEINGVLVGVVSPAVLGAPIGVSKSRVVTKTEPISKATAKTASSLRRVASERRNSVIRRWVSVGSMVFSEYVTLLCLSNEWM